MQVNNFIRKSIEYHKSQFAINHHKSKTKRATANNPKSKIENQQYKNTKSKSSIQVWLKPFETIRPMQSVTRHVDHILVGRLFQLRIIPRLNAVTPAESSTQRELRTRRRLVSSNVKTNQWRSGLGFVTLRSEKSAIRLTSVHLTRAVLFWAHKQRLTLGNLIGTDAKNSIGNGEPTLEDGKSKNN